MALFVLGIFLTPNNKKEWPGGSEAPKKHNSRFEIPLDGGVLKTMEKDPDGNIELRLAKKIKISDDTFIFRFSFPSESDVLGLPIGKHVIFSADIPTKEHPEGELCCRKYTPISKIDQKGWVDFVIKIYKAGVHPRFPDGGIMT